MSDDLSIPNAGYRDTPARRYGFGRGRARSSMDPDTRRLVLFAGGLGAVLVALIGASFLVGHHSTEVPTVVADSRPVRVKPENPGGMKIDAAENDVFSGGADNKNARLGAPAEVPDPGRLSASVPLAPPPPEPTAPAAAPAKPVVVASNAAPRLAPAKAPVAAVEARPSGAVEARPSGAVEARPSGAVEAKPPAAAHQAMVQLAALTSEDAARNEWQLLSKRMPELLNGRQPNFSRAERDGRTFWRVRTAGFADLAQAKSFCERVRAKGTGCTVADF